MEKDIKRRNWLCEEYFGILIFVEVLTKEPSKRITLKEVLQHPWLTRDIKGIRDARRGSIPATAFELYSLVKPDVEAVKDAQSKDNK